MGCTVPKEPEVKEPSCGEPINPATGNMWHVERDLVPANGRGTAITRTYNSSPYSWADKSPLFGARWSTAFDVRIMPAPMIPRNMPPGKCWRRLDTKQIWCSNSISPPAGTLAEAVQISRGDGKRYIFNRVGLDWTGDSDNNNRLVAAYNADQTAIEGWTFTSAAGESVSRFDKDGILLSIRSRSGTEQRLTYSNGATNDTQVGRLPLDAPACSNVQAGVAMKAGRLLCVTDSDGRQVQFEYDADGRVAKMLDPALQATTYAYDGPTSGCTPGPTNNLACWTNNLVKVTYPGGTSHTYHYNEKAQINGGALCAGAMDVAPGFGHLLNALTGLTDENNVRYISWTYDCAGKALSSQLANGVEKVVLSYGVPDANGNSTTTATHFVGDPANPATTVRQFGYGNVLAGKYNTSMNAPCPECGPYKSRTFNANGNLESTTDFNNVVTKYVHELPRNLVSSRTEAFGTPQARTILTTWHPTFRLPKTITEPGRVTTFDYDTSGNMLKKSVTAGGLTRNVDYTYNNTGQLLTVTGPRTDVVNKTQYGYDGQGNLASVTNAAGHATYLSNYDANGRAGRITDANGRTTDMIYSPRGKLTSSSSNGLTTTYDYDDVGQLLKVTLPGAVIIHYSYDDAHRLTKISDDLGNSITYTLDLRGNRTAEKVTDPNGVLKRQTTRVFDLFNRLQQVTGGQQ